MKKDYMGWSKRGYQRFFISPFPKSPSRFPLSLKSSSKRSSPSKSPFTLSLSLKSSREFPSSSRYSSYYYNIHKSSFRSNLFHDSSFRIISILFLVILRWATSVSAQGAFFRNLLSVPEHCDNEGIGFNTCSFLFSCYYEGGTPQRACGGVFLYTCCEKPVATVRSDISNDISSFNFFGDTSKFLPRLPSFGRNRSPLPPPPPPPPLPLLPPHLRHFNFPPNKNLIPVRASPSFRRDFPSKYFLSARDESTHLTHLENDVIEVDHRYYNEPECGLQRTRQFAKRIIGGDEAAFAELPWQAHIRIAGYQCGGVLLNRFFVATAAHCVHKARLSQIRIHLGEYDTKDTGHYYEPFPKETFAVVEKRTHPRFKYMLTQPDRFDVAVLRLSHPVTYRQNIVPICLPSPNDDFEGAIGIVAGWGKTDTSFGKTGTNILRKVTVPVINNKECLRWHHLKGIDVKLHFEMFCAGHSEGKMDACLGDSGGPLVIHHRGRWRLAGITSAGFGCAVDHQPGIYHKVSITAGWIAGNIRP